MTIADGASNLEQAQTGGFPSASSHSPGQFAFRVPMAAITELFPSSNPAKRDLQTENNGRPTVDQGLRRGAAGGRTDGEAEDLPSKRT